MPGRLSDLILAYALLFGGLNQTFFRYIIEHLLAMTDTFVPLMRLEGRSGSMITVPSTWNNLKLEEIQISPLGMHGISTAVPSNNFHTFPSGGVKILGAQASLEKNVFAV